MVKDANSREKGREKASEPPASFLKRRKFLLFLLAFAALAIIAIMAFANLLFYELPRGIESGGFASLQRSLQQKMVDAANGVLRAVDEINLFRFKRNLLDGHMPVYSLKFSANDLRFFDNLSDSAVDAGYLPAELNRWRDAELDYDGRNYRVKVKLHGDLPNHWGSSLKSYNVKSEERQINGMARFNLVIFEDRQLAGMIGSSIAADFRLFEIADDVVVLKINGVQQGLYYVQEDFDSGLLEKNRCSSCVLLQTTDNFVEDHPRGRSQNYNGITAGRVHGTAFDGEISNLNIDAEERLIMPVPLALHAYEQLFQEVREGVWEEVWERDVAGARSFFDLEYLSSFEAFRMVIGDPHLVQGDNLRLAYSASLGKFFPLPRVEGLDRLRLELGGVEHSLNLRAPLFQLLAGDDSLRYLRNRKAYEYALQQEEIMKKIDSLLEKYSPYALSYRTNRLSTPYMKYRLRRDREAIAHNLETIRKNLEYSKAYLTVIELDEGSSRNREGDLTWEAWGGEAESSGSETANGEGRAITLRVIPDSIAEIRFTKLLLLLSRPYSGSVTITYRFPGNAFQISDSNAANATNPANAAFQNTASASYPAIHSASQDFSNPAAAKVPANPAFTGNPALTWQALTFFLPEPASMINLTPAVQDFLFSAGLDEELFPARRDYEMEITFNSGDSATTSAITSAALLKEVIAEMENAVTGNKILPQDIYVQIADGRNNFPGGSSLPFQEFQRKYPQFRWEYRNGELTLKSGSYALEEHLIIPAYSRLVIEEGTTLSLGEGVAILSYSPVSILGSAGRPVVVKPLNPGKPFGSFGIIGGAIVERWSATGSTPDEKNQDAGNSNENAENSVPGLARGRELNIIRGLDLSGGSEQVLNGIYLSGGLSIHGMDVEIHNSIIHGNRADDGLNVKYGKVLLDGVRFHSNFADQFDCDFCSGVVKNSDFAGGLGGDFAHGSTIGSPASRNSADSSDGALAGDANGDGLDLSGSAVLVHHNTFSGFKDKGVSIGEDSEVVLFGNDFRSNNWGAAVKDRSHAFFLENRFEDNALAAYAYQKKIIFGGAKAYFNGNRLSGNREQFAKDKLSYIYNLNLLPADAAALSAAVESDDAESALSIMEKYRSG